MSAAVRRPAAAASDRARILVVDDVPMFRELEQLFLSRLGQVRTAGSAEEALREAMDFGPQVIVLDMHLPDRAGDEIADELRQASAPDCVIVFITTGRASEHARAVDAGAVDVLSKPLARGTLVQSISRFIGAPQHPRGLPRVDHLAPVRLVGERRKAQGVIRNLSRGGLFIQADWLPPTGTEMTVAFDLPGVRQKLEPTARIVWRRLGAGAGKESGIGVRFLSLDGTCSRELDDFVQERTAPEPFWPATPEL